MSESKPNSAVGIFGRVFPTLMVLLIGSAIAFSLLTLKPKPEISEPKLAPIPKVSVILAQPKTETLKVKSQGTVEPLREIDLIVQVAGKISKVSDNFVVGGFFSAEFPLVEIDSRDYELALIKSAARVADSAQKLATEKGLSRQVRTQWRDLGNREANDLLLRKPQLASARANLAAAKADRDKVLLDLERTKISVPFSGRIRSKFVDLGQFVSPGSKIATVYDTSVALVRLPLTDSQAGLVDLPLGHREGQYRSEIAVEIMGTVGGEVYQWQGRIVGTDASLDTNTRLYYAIVEVIDPFIEKPEQAQVPLVIGLFVDALISGRTIDDVVVVPRKAVFKNNLVYTVDQNNRVLLKHVQVLSTTKEKAWIKGDFKSGEPIIVGGQNFLSNNAIVDTIPIQNYMEKTSALSNL